MSDSNLTADGIPERLQFVLASGQNTVMTKENAVHWLKHLLEFYNGQEKDWYDKTYNGERSPSFCIGNENEWMRYRQEAGALAYAIQVISGESPCEKT